MTRSTMLTVRRLVHAIMLGVMVVFAASAQAHESRPAYLEVNEIAPHRYSLLWRTPLLSGQRLPVVLKLPDGVRSPSEHALRELSDSLIERRIVEADGGLAGKRIEFVGLQATHYRCPGSRAAAGRYIVDQAGSTVAALDRHFRVSRHVLCCGDLYLSWHRAHSVWL